MSLTITPSFVAHQTAKASDMEQLKSDIQTWANGIGTGWVTIASSAWASVTSAPVLGNGTWSAKYSTIGNRTALSISLIWGSTTSTVGTGAWIINLPFTVTRGCVFTGIVFDSSTGNAITVTGRSDGGSTQIVRLYIGDGTTSVVGEGTPWAWATGDFLYLNGVVENN
jgi:hypothetical protein